MDEQGGTEESDGTAVPFVPIVPGQASSTGAVPAGGAGALDTSGGSADSVNGGPVRRLPLIVGAVVLAAAVVAVALVAGGRSGTGDSATGPAAPTATSVPSEPVGPSTSAGGGADAAEPACGRAGAVPLPTESGGTPVDGGVLTMALAEESDGFDPTRVGFSPSGLLVASTIYDPLAVWQDGEVVPWLAESITADPTAQVWTIRLRPGVTFHDGLPLDAEALRANVEASRANRLLGPAYATIQQVEVTGPLEVRLTMAVPWPAFANLLTSQFGYIESPAVIGTERAREAPVGTGPFRFEEWQPGRSFTVVRNPSYWRAGEPHLDGVEFRVVSDPFSRQRAIQGGQVQALVTDDADAVAAATRAGLPTGVGLESVSFVTLNTLIPPFDDVRARRAVALATDRGALAASDDSGLLEPAASPFPSDNPWCVPDSGVARHDPEAARALADAYAADNDGPLSFTLLVPSNPTDARVADQLAAQWRAAGIDVELQPDQEPAIAMSLVGGRYQAGLHRLRAPADPDVLYDWFHAGPASIGKGLNLSRIEDPELDRLLDLGRTSTDPAVRRQAYDDMVRRLNELAAFVWLTAEPGAIVTTPEVRGSAALLDPARNLSAPWASTVWLAR